MSEAVVNELFGLKGKVAAITGGGGVLCSAMSKLLGKLGVKVAVLDLNPAGAQQVVDEIKSGGGEAVVVECNVLKPESVQAACKSVVDAFGKIDILINGAGGNKKEATANAEMPFFDIPPEAAKWVLELNCIGTILPCQVFGKLMAEQKSGTIINISSMCAFTPLTNVVSYSAAKAAVSNFTQWLAVHMAQTYSTDIRVNAIAPGFFLTEQNRFLLTREGTGELTPRGNTIVSHTPAGRFGDPDDLLSTLVWLLGDGARFVTGIVVPVDGGFSAFSGV